MCVTLASINADDIMDRVYCKHTQNTIYTVIMSQIGKCLGLDNFDLVKRSHSSERDGCELIKYTAVASLCENLESHKFALNWYQIMEVARMRL